MILFPILNTVIYKLLIFVSGIAGSLVDLND